MGIYINTKNIVTCSYSTSTGILDRLDVFCAEMHLFYNNSIFRQKIKFVADTSEFA